jgi:diguanylate cyclase (GGDEF)-like protein/PAS domain S-box-containing protein
MNNPDVKFLFFKIHFTASEQAFRYKIVLIYTVATLTATVTAGVGLYRVLTDFEPLVGVFDLIYSGLNVALLIFLARHKEKYEAIASIALSLPFLLFFTVYLIAPYSARLTMFFPQVAGAFFLKGRRAGRLWLVLVILTIVGGNLFLAAIANYTTMFAPPYSRFDIIMACLYLTGLFFIIESYEFYKDDQRRLAEEQEVLQRTEERWRLALEGAGDSVWDLDMRTGEFHYSKRFAQMLGYDENELGHQHENFLDLLHPQDRPRVEAEFVACSAPSADRLAVECRLAMKDGRWRWTLARGRVTRHDADGRPLQMAGTVSDIAERKVLEAELLRLATTDPLTGAANRRRFLEQMEMELARVKRHGKPAAFLMADIDHFKEVNDAHGHAVGDAVIQHLAELARKRLRRSDLFARLGGEEFGILLPETDLAAARGFADLFRRQAADAPMQSAKGAISITISVGVSELDPSDASPDPVLSRADKALYRAKEGGRNRVEIEPPPTPSFP